MDQALFDRHFATYGKLIADWAHDRSEYHFSNRSKLNAAIALMPSADECKELQTQMFIKRYILAGLPIDEEHSKVMNEMYEKEIENPYRLRLCCAGFASTKVNRTDIEELMIGYNKEYENTAQELFTEFVVAAFPGEKIICDGDDYGFSASEYIINVDKVQKEKTPQSKKKNGKSSSVDKTEKQKKESNKIDDLSKTLAATSIKTPSSSTTKKGQFGGSSRSAAVRTKGAQLEDDYYTPPEATVALLKYLEGKKIKLDGMTALEPCYGVGHIARVLEMYSYLTLINQTI